VVYRVDVDSCRMACPEPVCSGMIRPMSKTSMHDYARIGAAVRLAEIKLEIAAIRDAFPDMAGQSEKRRRGRPKAQAAGSEPEPQGSAAPKRKMSAAARKSISDAQKKRWAAQRAKAA
jgi:hypothetical protein